MFSVAESHQNYEIRPQKSNHHSETEAALKKTAAFKNPQDGMDLHKNDNVINTLPESEAEIEGKIG